MTFNGGSQSGWIRAILYMNNQEVARSTGPASMGGGAGYPITFTKTGSNNSGALLTAPTAAGTYSYQAAWFGNSNNSGSTHGEVRVSSNDFTVAAPAPTLSSLAISGSTSVNEGATATYTATATYSDGSKQTVAATWSASAGSISSAGLFTAPQVTANQTVNINASFGGVSAPAYPVTVVNVAAPPPTGAVTTMPADGASDVPVTTVVTTTGDGSADISTVVNENTFSLMEGSPVAMTTNMSESDDDHPECVSEGIVNGSITYNTSHTVATFTPLCTLKGSTTYTATITPPAGVQQSVLAGPMVWSFTTIAMIPDSDDDGDPDAGDDSPKDCRNATPGTPKGKGKITMTLDGHPNGCFKNITAASETVPSVNRTGMPSGYEFRDGIITYEIHGVPPGETDTVTLTYPEAFPAGSKVYKVDAGGFHEYTDAVIDGNTVTLRVTDGGKGDMDGTADGKILDPVGVAVPTASGGGSIDLSTGASGGGCSVVGAGGGWKEAAGIYGLLALAWIGLALRRRRPKSGK